MLLCAAPVPKLGVVCPCDSVLACLLLGEVGAGRIVDEGELGCPFHCSVSLEMENARVLVSVFCFPDDAETMLAGRIKVTQKREMHVKWGEGWEGTKASFQKQKSHSSCHSSAVSSFPEWMFKVAAGLLLFKIKSFPEG